MFRKQEGMETSADNHKKETIRMPNYMKYKLRMHRLRPGISCPTSTQTSNSMIKQVRRRSLVSSSGCFSEAFKYIQNQQTVSSNFVF